MSDLNPNESIDGIVQDTQAAPDAAPEITMPAGCDAVAFKFNFKTRAVKDETGKEIGRTKKQPSIETVLPVPTHDTVAAFLANPDSAESKLIMAAVQDVIYTSARNQFDEIIEGFDGDESRVVAATMLDFSKLDLSYLANLPPSTRGSTVPSEEDFKAWFADYMAVMPAATGKDADKIKRHVELYSKPTRIKSNKPVLETLIGQLDIYLSQSQALEEHGTTAAYMHSKFTRWHAEPEKQINIDLL